MTADTVDQKVGGTLTNAVLTLSINVNAMTETPRDAMTTSARRILFSPDNDPPTITGNNEIVHGASTVSTPASNESKNSIICSAVYTPTAVCKAYFTYCLPPAQVPSAHSVICIPVLG